MEMAYEKPSTTQQEKFPGNTWELPTSMEIVEDLEQELGKRLVVAGWEDSDGTVESMQVAFREAILNAIIHGNLGIKKTEHPGPDFSWKKLADEHLATSHTNKKIGVTLEVTSDRVVVVVRDEGPGFRHQEVADPTQGENLFSNNGRGLVFMGI